MEQKKYYHKGRDERRTRTGERRERPMTQREESEIGNGAVIGRNAVRELLKSERAVDKLLVQKGERNGSIVVLVAQAIERGIPVIETDKAKLDGEYVTRMSLGFDIKCFFGTILSVLKHDGVVEGGTGEIHKEQQAKEQEQENAKK